MSVFKESSTKTLRSASGILAVNETTTPVTNVGKYKFAVVRLDMTLIDITTGVGMQLDFYLQTSHNGGTDWVDVENIHFTSGDDGTTQKKLLFLTRKRPTAADVAETETDGSVADNTKLDLPLGSHLRWKVVRTNDLAGKPRYNYSSEVFFKT